MPAVTVVPEVPIDAPEGLRVAPSPRHGNGVFATRRFAPGDVVERCPVLVIDAEHEDLVADTALDGYCYEWDGGLAVALGFGSLYNHDDDPNARYWTDTEAGCIEVVARRPIAAGDEVCVTYNGDPELDDPVEFPDA